jgi:hypothetical protein
MSEAFVLVSANPYAFSKQIDPPSSAKPPVVAIGSPQNNAGYSGAFNISFTVKCIEYSDYFSNIADVTYTLDNQNVTLPHDGDVLSIDDYYTSFEAPNLAPGNHSLTVRATGIAYQPIRDYFTMDSSSQIYFTVSDPNSDPAPTPTASPTSNPADNPASPLSLPPELLAVAVVVVVAVAVAVLLVWRRTRR